MKTASEYIVAFHIGRGGRFHNQGHKTFNPNIEKLSDLYDSSKHTIISEDADGEPLADKDWRLIDSGDNVILEGREAIESTTGILDWDGEYDTDIVQTIADCDENELCLLLEAYDNGEVDSDILPAIMEKWPNALEVVNDDDDVTYIGMDVETIKEAALFGEDSRIMANEVTIWESKHGEKKLNEILANY